MISRAGFEQSPVTEMTVFGSLNEDSVRKLEEANSMATVEHNMEDRLIALSRKL